MLHMISTQILTFAAEVPISDALSLGSAVGTGGALVWLLAKTMPDRERTLRELARAQRDGQRELAHAVNEFKDSMVRQLGDGNRQVIELLTALASPRVVPPHPRNNPMDRCGQKKSPSPSSHRGARSPWRPAEREGARGHSSRSHQ